MPTAALTRCPQTPSNVKKAVSETLEKPEVDQIFVPEFATATTTIYIQSPSLRHGETIKFHHFDFLTNQTLMGRHRSDFWDRLMLGRKDAVSIRALELALGLAVVTTVFDFVYLAAYEDVVYVDLPKGWVNFVLLDVFWQAFDDPVLIVGLAAIHAYLNEGYLPAILLAIAPFVGVRLWIFSGPFPGPYVLNLKPLVGEWEWIREVFQTAVPLATLGFLLGYGLRLIRVELLGLPEPIQA